MINQLRLILLILVVHLFKDVDNRLISLELVRLGMTDAVVFDENGTNVLPAQVLYKKNILTLRGSYRPMTNVNEEMFKKSLEAFLKEKKVKKEEYFSCI